MSHFPSANWISLIPTGWWDDKLWRQRQLWLSAPLLALWPEESYLIFLKLSILFFKIDSLRIKRDDISTMSGTEPVLHRVTEGHGVATTTKAAVPGDNVQLRLLLRCSYNFHALARGSHRFGRFPLFTLSILDNWSFHAYTGTQDQEQYQQSVCEAVIPVTLAYLWVIYYS